MTNPGPWTPDQNGSTNPGPQQRQQQPGHPYPPHEAPKKKFGCMKIGLIILGIFILIAILVTAINSGGLGDDEQSTILEGVTVPASAERTSSGADSEFFDIPDADFDEVAKWIGDRVPDEVGGLPLCGVDEGSTSRQWVWSEGGENVPLALLNVSGADETTRVTVARGEDVVDCGDSTPDQESAPAANNAPAPAQAPAEADVPREYDNALRSAKRYLSVSAFSQQGLAEQLQFEDYSPEAAQYAVDNVDADWNEEAAKKAQQYVDISPMSRQGLVDQLLFEKFTPEQAEYGASQQY